MASTPAPNRGRRFGGREKSNKTGMAISTTENSEVLAKAAEAIGCAKHLFLFTPGFSQVIMRHVDWKPFKRFHLVSCCVTPCRALEAKQSKFLCTSTKTSAI